MESNKMEAYQNSVSKESHKNPKQCHKRRPSLGKSMPITALLLNYPVPTKEYSKLGTDGLLPDEIDRPPIFFKVDNLNSEVSDDINNSDFEFLNYDQVEAKMHLQQEQDNLQTASGPFCTEIADKPFALKDMCEKICNENCNKNSKLDDMEDITNTKNLIDKISVKPITKSFLKVPSKLDLERKKFLDEILKDVQLDKIADIDFESDTKRNKITYLEEKERNVEKNINNKYTKINNKNCEDLSVADALARTSMMTSPAAKRRLAARKIEMELDFGRINQDSTDFIPPRDLLLYLVRMGSFNSAPKINNSDTQDDHLNIPNGLSSTDLIKHCKTLRGSEHPELLKRKFISSPTISHELLEGFRDLELSKSNKSNDCSKKYIRVLQWNILSQSLGQNNDGFVCCPDDALTWENRKYLIIEEILQNDPDIICLQEVDHYKFLEKVLGTQNYDGIFFPKPDSPCLYIEENNGPDGCAIFYKRELFELLNYDTRILEVWHVQSNQVAIVANFKIKESEKELTVCTTHLKARSGALLSKLRNEQGKDLLKFLNDVGGNRPVLLCGDFNAEPIEPIYNTVLSNRDLELSSAYAEINKQICLFNGYMTKDLECINKIHNENLNGQLNCNDDEKNHIVETMAKLEPPYTTWKIREEGEVCHTIDYVFFSRKHFQIRNCLQFPESEEIGKDRTPSYRYPSDHFSLVCDFELFDSKDSASTSTQNNISNNNFNIEKL